MTIPESHEFLVREAAAQVRRSPAYIRYLLYIHRDRFDPPRYERDGRHPRHVRVLSAKDLQVLKDILSEPEAKF